MEMKPVDSSNVRAVGYDDESNTLQVEFNNGSLYQYFDVPRYIFDGLIEADSPGGFLHQNVKGVYRYSRV
ncbi:KTSC domain-containing protein [uncultured Cohaesibacter sp.]|uniref:KTSC domain-containing protein n=1 Tax=uncultured Cohaesibacter sp. TaxID=1002546 RepID=UPI002AA8EBC9|nr:KTSC domain-containing protein [uncultured Cohaesibacter sp.]